MYVKLEQKSANYDFKCDYFFSVFSSYTWMEKAFSVSGYVEIEKKKGIEIIWKSDFFSFHIQVIEIRLPFFIPCVETETKF